MNQTSYHSQISVNQLLRSTLQTPHHLLCQDSDLTFNKITPLNSSIHQTNVYTEIQDALRKFIYDQKSQSASWFKLRQSVCNSLSLFRQTLKRQSQIFNQIQPLRQSTQIQSMRMQNQKLRSEIEFLQNQIKFKKYCQEISENSQRLHQCNCKGFNLQATQHLFQALQINQKLLKQIETKQSSQIFTFPGNSKQMICIQSKSQQLKKQTNLAQFIVPQFNKQFFVDKNVQSYNLIQIYNDTPQQIQNKFNVSDLKDTAMNTQKIQLQDRCIQLQKDLNFQKVIEIRIQAIPVLYQYVKIFFNCIAQILKVVPGNSCKVLRKRLFELKKQLIKRQFQNMECLLRLVYESMQQFNEAVLNSYSLKNLKF